MRSALRTGCGPWDLPSLLPRSSSPSARGHRSRPPAPTPQEPRAPPHGQPPPPKGQEPRGLRPGLQRRPRGLRSGPPGPWTAARGRPPRVSPAPRGGHRPKLTAALHPVSRMRTPAQRSRPPATSPTRAEARRPHLPRPADLGQVSAARAPPPPPPPRRPPPPAPGFAPPTGLAPPSLAQPIGQHPWGRGSAPSSGALDAGCQQRPNPQTVPSSTTRVRLGLLRHPGLAAR